MNYEKAKDELLAKDSILENPKTLIDSIKFLEGSGLIDDAKRYLKSSYTGTLEVLFELWNWLSLLYDDPDSIVSIVQENIKKTIIQNYDRQKLFTLTNDPTTVSETLKWVYELIESQVWRQAIYELAEQPQNDGCPFLSMTMTCMAFKDKYLCELSQVPKSWSEMSTLMRCVRYLLEPLLSMSHELLTVDRDTYLQMKDQMGHLDICLESQEFQNNSKLVLFYYLDRFLEMGCHSEHTYLLLQALLQCLDRDTQYHVPQHLGRLLEEEAINRCADAAKYSVYFRNTRDYPEAMNAMKQIIIQSKIQTNHLQQVYDAYNSEMPPPVDLLRITLFIDLITDGLFVSGDAILPDQQQQLSYLLSYASVTEEFYDSDDTRVHFNKSHVMETKQMIEEASKICRQWVNAHGTGLSLRSFRDLSRLLDLARTVPCVAYGCFRFLDAVFLEKRSDFELNTESIRPYTILANELATCHSDLHPKLLRFLTGLLGTEIQGMEALREMEYKKCVVDMLIHLLYEGHGTPVISAISQLFTTNRADISLVRYFVVELLDLCQPPYSLEFMTSLEPLASDSDIQSGIQPGKEADSLQDFLDHCRNHMISSDQSTR